MKKIVTLLMLLCMVCTGAWADVATGSRSVKLSPAMQNNEFQTGTTFYTIKCYRNNGMLIGSALPTIREKASQAVTDDAKWAVIPVGGNGYVQFMNKQSKKVLTFASQNNDAASRLTETFSDVNSYMEFRTTTNSSFASGYECFRIGGNDSAYPNDKETYGLSIWNSNWALWGWQKSSTSPGNGDDGSKWLFTEVETISSVALESLTFAEATVTKNIGTVTQLVVNHAPEEANGAYTLSSSNPSVAFVDGNNKVHAISEGTATITATSTENPSITATCTFTVQKQDWYVHVSPEMGIHPTGGRVISQISLAGTNITVPSYSYPYVDLTSQSFTVSAGQSVTPGMTDVGWMHSMYYVDKDDDRQFTVEEMETHSTLTGSSGTVSGITAFTAPETPGIYRMRYKTDWHGNNANGNDPAGRLGDDGSLTGENSIWKNRGVIIDVMLKVTQNYTVQISLPEGLSGMPQVTIDGQNYANNATVAYPGTLTSDDVQATPIAGYEPRIVINNETNTVKVAYAADYTVNIVGAPEGETPKVTYSVTGAKYGHDEVFNAESLQYSTQLTADQYTGYKSAITVSNKVITVTYTPLIRYALTIAGYPNGQNPKVTYSVDGQQYGNGDAILVEGSLSEGQITYTAITNYTATVSIDNEAHTVKVTYTRESGVISSINDFVQGAVVSLYNPQTSKYVYCSNSSNILKWQDNLGSDDRKLVLVGDNENGFVLYCPQLQKYVKDMIADNNSTPLTANADEAGVYKFEAISGMENRFSVHNLTYTGSHQYMHINTSTAGVIAWNVGASDNLASCWQVTYEGYTESQPDLSTLTTYDENVINGVVGYATQGSTHPVAAFVASKTPSNLVALHKFLHSCRNSSRTYEDSRTYAVNKPVQDKSYYFRVDFSNNSASRYLYVNSEGALATSTDKPASKLGRWKFLEGGKIQNVGDNTIYLKQSSGIAKATEGDATSFEVSAGVKYGNLALLNGDVVVALASNGDIGGGQFSGGPIKNMDGNWSCDFFFEEVSLTTANFTYNYKLNGATVYTENFSNQTIGQDFPTSALPYGVDAAWHEGQISADDDGEAFDIVCTLNSNNEIDWATSYNDVQWKVMKMRGGYIFSDGTTTASAENTPASYLNYEKFLWGFVGSPFSFKIVNKVVGDNMYLNLKNNVVFDAQGHTFRTTASSNGSKTYGKFVIQDIIETNETTLHSTNSSPYALWNWTSGSAIGDLGSQVTIYEPEDNDGFLGVIKNAAKADFPADADAIDAMNTCAEVAEAYAVEVTYDIVGRWSETESYNFGSVVTRQAKNSTAALPAGTQAPDFYADPQIEESEKTVTSDNNHFTAIYTPAFPFTAGKIYRLHSARTEDNRKGDWYDANGTPKYYASGATMADKTNFWVIQHVEGTQDQFTVKNYATGRYLTFQSKDRQIGSLVAEPVNNGATTSYMRVRPSTESGKPAGAFVLMHSDNSTACMGPHINEDKSVGGWDGGNSALSNGTNCLEVLEVTSFKTKLNAVSGDGYYGTIYSDQKITVPAGIQAYGATVNGDFLRLIEAGDTYEPTLAPGAYVLYKQDADATASMDANITFATPDGSGIEVEGNVLSGTLIEGKPFTSELRYALSGKNGIGFYKYNPATYPVAKAVYVPAEPTAVAAFYFDFGDSLVTAIKELQKENEENGIVFDLQGRRIQKAQKGMNIINGRKVLR